jgi:FMN phosphatase YigB (HAD superfamily)
MDDVGLAGGLLARLFDAAVISGEVGIRKPTPAI